MVNQESMEQARELILAAFEDARASGNDNWQRMTAAVLKNRLLGITRREFKESAYGVTSLSDFVRLFPDILELDESSSQKVVLLKSVDSLPQSAEAPPVGTAQVGLMIRPDIWQAIVDYRSGDRYVWDPAQKIARTEQKEGEDLSSVPTLTEAEVQKWREDFAEQVDGEITSADRTRVTQWIQKRYSTKYLPAQLQYRWNGYMREHISIRMEEFFRGISESVPEDLILDSSRLPGVRKSLRRVDASFSDLRSLVQRCVEVMTDQELGQLKISPDVFLRASRGFGG